MKFSAVTLACLATGACARRAEPPVRVFKRQVTTATGVIDEVGQAIDSLSSSFMAYNGNAAPIEKAAANVVSAIEKGKTKVDGSGQLTLADAVGLQQPVKDLQSKSESLVSELKSRKSMIQSSGMCGNVRQATNSIAANSQALIKAVVLKVPTEAQPIAQGQAKGLLQVLEDAQAAFSEQNCQGGSSSGSSSAGGGSMSAGGSSTSAGGGSNPTGSASAAVSGSSKPTSPTYTSARATASAAYSGNAGGGGTAYSTGSRGGRPMGNTTVPVVTAGAGSLVGPAGALAMAAAAVLL